MQIATGTRGDREGDAVEVLGDREHDDAGAGVRGEQPADGLHAAEAGHAYVHQNQVRAVRAPAAEDFLAVGRGGHALDAGHGRDRAAERLSGKRGVVADENGCHA